MMKITDYISQYNEALADCRARSQEAKDKRKEVALNFIKRCIEEERTLTIIHAKYNLIIDKESLPVLYEAYKNSEAMNIMHVIKELNQVTNALKPK